MSTVKRYSIVRTILAAFLCLAVMAGIALASVRSLAVSYDKVADASDMTTVEEVGIEGMEPIALKNVENGTYEVKVESSSSMFKVDSANLTVADGEGNLTLTLASTSYPYLYAGTAKDAAALNDPAKYIAPEEDAEGKYNFKLPLPNLDEGFPCAAFSQRKEQWYDRTLLVRADSLPKKALKVKLPDYEALEKAAQEKRIEKLRQEQDAKLADLAAPVTLHNGSYNINVSLKGGSGKASITSPTTLTVINGKAFATILWSSPNYDYMIVGGEKLTPQNIEEGSNSSFLIPILKFDEPFKVIADTTAMSKPHEIEYELTFEQDSIKRYSNSLWVYMLLAFMVVLAGAFGVYWFWISDWGTKKKK